MLAGGVILERAAHTGNRSIHSRCIVGLTFVIRACRLMNKWLPIYGGLRDDCCMRLFAACARSLCVTVTNEVSSNSAVITKASGRPFLYRSKVVSALSRSHTEGVAY